MAFGQGPPMCFDCSRAAKKVKATRIIPGDRSASFVNWKRVKGKIAVCEEHYRERYGLPVPVSTRPAPSRRAAVR